MFQKIKLKIQSCLKNGRLSNSIQGSIGNKVNLELAGRYLTCNDMIILCDKPGFLMIEESSKLTQKNILTLFLIIMFLSFLTCKRLKGPFARLKRMLYIKK